MAEVAKGIIDIEINTGPAAQNLQALQAKINAFNLALNKGNKAQSTFAAEYSRELQSAINKTGVFTAETVRLATAASTLDKTLSKGKVTLGQFFSAKFNKDSAIAAETMALAAERAARLQTQFVATSGAARGFQDALAVRPLAAFSAETAIAAQKAELMSAMFKQGTTQLINFGKNVQWAGRQLMVGFTVPLSIFGATAGKTFMELEKQVVSFKKVYGDLFTTPAEMNQNLEAVKGLASEYTKYGIAVKDTIGLAAQAAAAGRQNADLTDAVSQATRLATLGQMEQNAALETTISLQSAFRLSGKDLADTINFLNMVENQTVVSLQDIAAAIPRVAPVIAGLGGDVKDLSVFLAAMQEGGVDAAEGANALKSGLASLINPTKQAKEMLAGFGINLDAIVQANKGDLMGTVMAFSQALGTLDQFSKQQALEQVFGKFQYAKLGALFENISRDGSQASQVMETLGYSTEQLAATAEKELGAIEQSVGVQLTGAMERLKLAIAPIGELFVKIAIPVVNMVTKMVESFNGLSEGQKQFAAIAAIIGGVVIPAGTMFLGLLMNLTGTILKMGQGFGAFTKGLLTGGPLGAFRALSQSSKYLSLAELDAAMAAQQLAGASNAVNVALLEQVGAAGAAQAAIGKLTGAYMDMIATQQAASGASSFGVAGSAQEGVAKGKKPKGKGFTIKRALGGSVPGQGNQDTVPAMLTPGEFVVNKKATSQNLGLLKAINGGKSQRFNKGGMAGVQYFSEGGDVNRVRDLINRGILTPKDIEDGDYSENVKAKIREIFGISSDNETSNKDKKSENKKSKKPETQEQKRAASKKKPTFSHMQRNLVGGEGAMISGREATEIFEEVVRTGDLTPLEKAYAKVLKTVGYAGSRITGNLGFDVSGYLNSGVNQVDDLINDLEWRRQDGNDPYRRMLLATGVPEKDVAKVSEDVHRRVSMRLKAMKRAGITTFVDSDLYPHMEKIVPMAMKRAGVSEANIGKLKAMSKISGAGGFRLGGISQKIVEIAKAAGIDISRVGNTKYHKVGSLTGGTKGISARGTSVSPAKLSKYSGPLSLLAQLVSTGIKRNSGGPIPGSGSQDTVPAMLTPGEFVINKKATSQNRELLESINNGGVQKFGIGGIVKKIVGAAAPVAAGLGGYEGGSRASQAAGIDNQFIEMGISMAAMSAATKISTVALGKVGIGSGAVSKMLPSLATEGTKFGSVIAKAVPLVSKFAGPVGWLVTAGLALKALGDSVEKSKKASIELTNAMYGSAERTRAIGEAFGRETNATLSKKSAVESALKSKISPEAEQAASEFAKTDTFNKMLEDIEKIKKSGGDAATAIRNQLTSAIMAGVITPEEAAAIASDLGTAVNDKGLSVRIVGQLTSLIGKDGENLLTDAARINAEITPQIDSAKLMSDAQQLYDDLNPLQKAQKFFFGGEDTYKQEQSILAISDLNVQALQKEAEARALLNLAVQEGTITLEEYNKQTLAINDASKKMQQDVLNARAGAFGFSSNEAMLSSAKAYANREQAILTNIDPSTGQALTAQQRNEMLNAGSQDATGKKALESLSQNKEFFNQQLIDMGMDETLAAQITSGIQKSFADGDVLNSANLFAKMIGGQISLQGGQAVSKMLSAGEIDTEAIDRVAEKVSFIENIPDITKRVQIESLGEAELSGLYEIAQQIENFPTPLTKEVLFKTLGFELTAAEVSQFMALDPVTQKDLVYNFRITLTETTVKNAEQYTGGNIDVYNKARLAADKKANDKATADFKAGIGNAFGNIGSTPSTSSGGGGGAKSKLEQMKKDLINRFDLVDKRLAMEARQYEDIIKKQQRLNELDQRQIEINNHALDQLSKQEDGVNKLYDARFKALDKVAQANDRLRQQEQSRVSLATALASGNIAAAAQAMSDMTAEQASSQLEDTRAALENQREADLRDLKVDVNGVMLTREQIQTRNDAIEETIYQRNLKMQTAQDEIYKIELKREANARAREKVETRLFLLEQKKYILEMQKQKKKGKLTSGEKKDLATYTTEYNKLVTEYNDTFGASMDTLMYGGKPRRFAMGSRVPGKGNTDKIPALLTPGEFVVRKSAAQTYMPLLEAINNGTMPSFNQPQFNAGIGAPTYSLPDTSAATIPSSNLKTEAASSMYNNTYNINVSVAGTNASPDEIANVVMGKLSRSNSSTVRGYRY